jgi:hypothetical protein
MRKFLRLLGRELKEAVFPTIFFLVIFEAGVVTKALILEPYSVTPIGLSVAFVGALTVAKAILILDRTGFANLFRRMPLAFGIAWKACLFMLLALLFHYLEELVPVWRTHGSLQAAIGQLENEVSWPHFWAMQIWLFLAVFLYTAITALDRHLGAGSIRRMLFTSKGPDA